MIWASVTIRVGVIAENNSQRYKKERPRRFHFLRLRSRPSTLSTVGFPKTRGIHAMGPLATLQISTTSASVKETWITDRKVWKAVSKYLLEIVGRITRRTPGATTSRGVMNGR